MSHDVYLITNIPDFDQAMHAPCSFNIIKRILYFVYLFIYFFITIVIIKFEYVEYNGPE